MKKIFSGLIVLIIIIVIIFYVTIREFNIISLINNIEQNSGIKIVLNDKGHWNFYPKITYNNSNIKILQKKNKIEIINAKVKFTKNYWPNSIININLKAPVINYNGIEIHNSNIVLNYKHPEIIVENFFGKIIEGDIKFNGNIYLNKIGKFNLQGSFNNISLNSILMQSQSANWDRLDVKISSEKFAISGENMGGKDIINSIVGTIPINGSMYFVTSDDERFGIAFLTLLVEKMPSLSSISRSINFIVSNYANSPSTLSGEIKLNSGIMTSENIVISNNSNRLILKGIYDLQNDNLDGKIFFYEKDENILEAKLVGNINDPQILVKGKNIFENKSEPYQDIKKLLSDGINSFIERILTKDE